MTHPVDLSEEFQTYMLVVAHPDDSEFSSAGTVARLKDAGRKVILIQVTSGDKGSPDVNANSEDLAKLREGEMTEAASRLGMDEVVFRPYALHPDHRAVGLASTDAVYPTARDPLYFPEHLKDGLQPHKTAEIWFFGAEHPDKLVDITETFDRKMHALRAHESQVGGSEDLEERMRDRARELAEGQSFELAEAFKVIQMRR
jgi:LmbE family N-acetylglucosaminyl deacetylase